VDSIMARSRFIASLRSRIHRSRPLLPSKILLAIRRRTIHKPNIDTGGEFRIEGIKTGTLARLLWDAYEAVGKAIEDAAVVTIGHKNGHAAQRTHLQAPQRSRTNLFKALIF
jgi:hypothetical protein